MINTWCSVYGNCQIKNNVMDETVHKRITAVYIYLPERKVMSVCLLECNKKYACNLQLVVLIDFGGTSWEDPKAATEK